MKKSSTLLHSNFLARILNFILHTYYIPVYIISSAVQHAPWALDFLPSTHMALAPGFENWMAKN